jgi:hypothetical protein
MKQKNEQTLKTKAIQCKRHLKSNLKMSNQSRLGKRAQCNVSFRQCFFNNPPHKKVNSQSIQFFAIDQPRSHDADDETPIVGANKWLLSLRKPADGAVARKVERCS